MESLNTTDNFAVAAIDTECGFSYSGRLLGRPSCPRPASEPDGRCLLHSPNPDKDHEAFWRLIEQQLTSSDCDFVGYVFPTQADFNRAKFSDRADFYGATFSGHASFYEAKFAGLANFDQVEFSGHASFDQVEFSGHTSFNWAKLSGYASFYGATFSGWASFNGATFSDQAYFGGAKFSDQAVFNQVKFSDQAIFDQVEFSGQANFNRAKFSDQAVFNQVKFSDQAIFNQVEFSDQANFDQVEFSDQANFDQVEFAGQANFNEAEFAGRAYFGEAKFAERAYFNTDLEHATFRSTNLRHCRFAGAYNLDKAEFDHVEWARWPPSLSIRPGQRPRIAVADELDARQTGSTPWQEIERHLRAAERVYRALRASHESRRDHPRVGGFYFAEMEMRRLASSSSWLGQTFGSLTAWYGLISGYGERWARALGWSIGVCLLWAVLYLVAGLWIKTPAISNTGLAETHLVFVGVASAPPGVPAISGSPLELYGHALLHSFLVATLIGRDIYAQPINVFGQVAQTVEIVLGPLLLGLIGLAIRRQFQR